VIPPVFTLVTGANGAGKSTLTSGNPETFSRFPLLDPDKVARPLSSTAANSPIAAGREVLRLAQAYLRRRESFTVETTLSGNNYLEMMVRARTLGFEIVLVYIGTETSRSTSCASRIGSLPEATMFRRRIFGDVSGAASTICRWRQSERTPHCSSITRPTTAISSWASCRPPPFSGLSHCPTGRQL
jgi:hypothetical protein